MILDISHEVSVQFIAVHEQGQSARYQREHEPVVR